MVHEPYRPTFVVRWSDVDANGHMKNTAYLDVCVDVRFGFFHRQGFTTVEFLRSGIGPVVRRDEVEYFREMRFRDPYAVDIALAGLSPDGSRFAIRNRFYRDDGNLAARVTSTGGWLDLANRRLTVPPETLLRALADLDRTEDFSVLDSSIR